MSKEHPSSNLQMIPIDKIEVLNPRDRNGRIFDDIVGNIKNIGLKKPITVTPRKDGDGREKFLLISFSAAREAVRASKNPTLSSNNACKPFSTMSDWINCQNVSSISCPY